MNFAAAKLGAGVPGGPRSGVVRSVFANAALLSLGGRLTSIVPLAAGGLPNGVTLDEAPRFDFRRLLCEGQVVAARGGVLRFSGGACVDLRPARPWRSRLSELTLNARDPGTTRAWRAAADILCADGRWRAIASLGRGAIAALCAAGRRCDLAAAESAISSLVGLGEGTTPAGDDVLVGFFAALHASWGAEGARGAFVAAAGRALRAAAARTSEVSRVYLDAIAEGEASERLTAVAASIADAAPAAGVADAARAAIAVGHTSGAAGVYGLILGLGRIGSGEIFQSSERLLDGQH
jgi:hypothetical protein